VVVLLSLMLGEALTGMYVANDVADEGPLTELTPAWIANAITALHALLWEALLAAVALHVAAIVVYLWVKGQNLLRPMISGRKELPVGVPPPRMESLSRAAALLAGSALIAAALVKFL